MSDSPANAFPNESTAQATPGNDGPVFILSASRSGSTLLRFILDSHPDLACPPETLIGSTCASMLHLFDCLEHSGTAERTDALAEPDVSPEAMSIIRNTIDSAYGIYLSRRAKKRWCDKSLDTYQFPELITKVYPQARFICLVRHCMDVIASGASICPWGLRRHGFDPFVLQFPGNTPAAIGAYWLACVQAALAFQDKNPASCLLVRYEDLVTAPESTLAGILEFIGASPAPGIADACFHLPHEARGPGDEKIWFTDRVSAASVGQGVSVPVMALPPQMQAPINEILTRLRYKVLDDWRGAVGRFDPRADAPPLPAPATGNGNGRAATELDPVTSALRDRLTSGSAAAGARILSQWPSVAGVTVRLIAESPSGAHAEVSWQFPAGNGHGTCADAGQAAPEGTALMIASSQTWTALLEGRANIITEMLEHRLRCYNPNDAHRLRSDEMHAIGALLGLTNVPVATWAGTPASTRRTGITAGQATGQGAR